MKKATISILMTLFFMCGAAIALQAQDNAKQPDKKGMMKKVIIVNGDTTVNEETQLNKAQMEKFERELGEEAGAEEGVQKMVIITEDEDGQTQKKVMMFKGDVEHPMMNESGENVWVDENGKKHKMKTITKEIESDNMGGTKTVIITEDENGNKQKKVIMSDGDGPHHEMSINNDMEWTDKDGKKHKMKVVTEDIEVEEKGDGSKTVIRKIRVMISDANSKELPTSLQENGSKELNDINLNVYPNPAGDEVTVSFETKKKGTTRILLTDMQGKELYSEGIADFKGKYEEKIPLKDNPSGVYLLQVSQNGKAVTKKIIKK